LQDWNSKREKPWAWRQVPVPNSSPPPTPISRAGVKVAVGVKPLGEKVLVLQRSCLSELRTNHKLGVKMVFMVVEVLSVLTFSLE
jgi:hypothetical protein